MESLDDDYDNQKKNIKRMSTGNISAHSQMSPDSGKDKKTRSKSPRKRKDKKKNSKIEKVDEEDGEDENIEDCFDLDELEDEYEEPKVDLVAQLPSAQEKKAPGNPMLLGGFGKKKEDKKGEDNMNNTGYTKSTAPDTVVTDNTNEEKDTVHYIKSNEDEIENLSHQADVHTISGIQSENITPKNNVNEGGAEKLGDLSNFIESQKDDFAKTGSKKSMMSKNSKSSKAGGGGGGGVNPLIITGLQNKVEGISAKIEEIYAKADDN